MVRLRKLTEHRYQPLNECPRVSYSVARCLYRATFINLNILFQQVFAFSKLLPMFIFVVEKNDFQAVFLLSLSV